MTENQIRSARRHDYRCSFCGKFQDKVKRLIAGPHGVYICNECIDLCNEIIHEEEAALEKPRPQEYQQKGAWKASSSARIRKKE